MEQQPGEEKSSNKKLLYDVNKSDLIIENEYCPHIYDHFLNTYMNSKFKKINISHIESEPDPKIENQDKKLIYIPNL